MKRALVVIAVVGSLAVGSVAYVTVDACSWWQDRYKQYVYSEMMKNSPIILPDGGVEAIIGQRPINCDGPPYELTHADMDRFRSEGIGPNSFLEETRAAFKRS